MTQEPRAHEVARECQFTTFCNLLLCRDIAPSSLAYSLPDGYLHGVHNQKPDISERPPAQLSVTS
jgi:hypothetical protein